MNLRNGKRATLRPRVGTRRALLGVCAITPAALLAATVLPADGQVRGMPLFFEPTYTYDARAGIDIGHGGEIDGFTMVGSGTLHFMPGNCRRFSISAAAGAWFPPGDASAHFSGAAGTQLLLNPCPGVLDVSNWTFRVITGVGLVSGNGTSAWNAPIGIGAGYKLPIAVAELEPWIIPHAVYREPIEVGDSRWSGAVSAGITVGLSGTFGLRVAAQCCIDGVAGAYGVSFWF